ncbi:hypothetical protein AB6A40_006524 [Gnathostoma spinigerum]|uniref:Uncharacterized protein n=1 Tax=Gnathostoma spinigerum TaxID=75299 RepID=A0ABD6EU93_9BILA
MQLDINQPTKVSAFRGEGDAFINDSPLTRTGALCAQLVGTAITARSDSIKAIYSSPTLKCLQTAASVSNALRQRKFVKIRVEAAIFAPLAFYTNYYLPTFLPQDEMYANGILYDTNYEPIISFETLAANHLLEGVGEFYGRIRKFVEHLKKRIELDRATFIVITHPAVMDAIYRLFCGINDIPKQINDLKALQTRYPHCSTLVLQKQEGSEHWENLTEELPPLTTVGIVVKARPPSFSENECEEESSCESGDEEESRDGREADSESSDVPMKSEDIEELAESDSNDGSQESGGKKEGDGEKDESEEGISGGEDGREDIEKHKAAKSTTITLTRKHDTSRVSCETEAMPKVSKRPSVDDSSSTQRDSSM